MERTGEGMRSLSRYLPRPGRHITKERSPMSHSQSLRSKFLLMPAMLVALLALISLATSGVAHAEEPKGYGESDPIWGNWRCKGTSG